MGEGAVGTSGGAGRAGGSRRRLALAMLAAFVIFLIVATIGNAESMIADLAAADVRVAPAYVWIWQVTSMTAWASVMPVIWWAVARAWPPRLSWQMAAVVGLIGIPLASAWHIGVMIGLRHIVYWTLGETYRFEGAIDSPYLYEFRKDIATYLQFVTVAVLCQWLLARVGTLTSCDADISLSSPEPASMIEVVDGAVTRHVPIEEIDHVVAAGNYVELAWGDRILLHRATLTATEAELGDRFARIHRGRLVRRTAIRAVEVTRTGDFEVVLSSGTRLKGSRRYRLGI